MSHPVFLRGLLTRPGRSQRIACPPPRAQHRDGRLPARSGRRTRECRPRVCRPGPCTRMSRHAPEGEPPSYAIEQGMLASLLPNHRMRSCERPSRRCLLHVPTPHRTHRPWSRWTGSVTPSMPTLTGARDRGTVATHGAETPSNINTQQRQPALPLRGATKFSR